MLYSNRFVGNAFFGDRKNMFGYVRCMGVQIIVPQTIPISFCCFRSEKCKVTTVITGYLKAPKILMRECARAV